MKFGKRKKYRVPEALVRYLCGFPEAHVVREIAWNLRKMGWDPEGKVQFQTDRLSGDVEEDEMLMNVANELAAREHAEEFVRGVVV